MTVTFQSNIDAFNQALGQYVRLTKLSTQEAVAKKSADFAFRLSRSLSTFAPKKGAIRAERLAALRSGQGIRVRPAVYDQVYKTKGLVQDIKTRRFGFATRKRIRGSKLSGGKRLNLQALAVKKELTLRESGRGFLSYSTRLRSVIQEIAIRDDIDVYRSILDKYNRFLSSVGFRTSTDEARMTFQWGGNKSSGEIAKTLQKPRQQRTIAQALDDSRKDMLTYIQRKQSQAKASLATI